MKDFGRGAAAAGLVALALTCMQATPEGATVPVIPASVCGGVAAAVTSDAYYAIELVPTKRVPGTGASKGSAMVTFARSPFGVAVGAGGSYAQALDIRVEGLRPRASDTFVVWAATSDLEHVVRLGVLDAEAKGHVSAHVEWNKFLLVVTAEAPDAVAGDRWQGPIVMRGMSRSGMMHTMAGHGPFELESCLKYGYR